MAIGRNVTESLANFEIPVFSSSVCQRVAFAESATQGSTVVELEPESSAATEIKQLASELLSFVNTIPNTEKEKAA